MVGLKGSAKMSLMANMLNNVHLLESEMLLSKVKNG